MGKRTWTRVGIGGRSFFLQVSKNWDLRAIFGGTLDRKKISTKLLLHTSAYNAMNRGRKEGRCCEKNIRTGGIGRTSCGRQDSGLKHSGDF